MEREKIRVSLFPPCPLGRQGPLSSTKSCGEDRGRETEREREEEEERKMERERCRMGRRGCLRSGGASASVLPMNSQGRDAMG